MKHFFTCRDRSVLMPAAAWAATAMVAAGASTNLAHAETLLVSEFYEEILSIDTDTGAVVDLVDSPIGANEPRGHHLEFGSDGSLYVTDFGDLYTFTPGSPNPYTFKMGLDRGSFTSITRDHGGNLIAISGSTGDGVLRINPNTGAVAVVHEEKYFGPRDVAVDAAGNIFVAEFFDGLGYIPAGGNGFIQIGDFSANQFAHLTIGTDGQLYAATNTNYDIARIDPVTGHMTTLAEDAFTFIDDILIDDDNTLYIAGTTNGTSGVYRLNGDTPELIVGNDTIGLFSPQSLALNTGFRATAIPEPSALALAALASLGFMRRRRSA